MRPAPVDHGVVFCRTDLPGAPRVPALVTGVTDLVRKTTIAANGAEVFLVEHVLSAIHGCGVDNVLVEMNAAEAPIMDGSAKAFADLIGAAGVVELDAPQSYYVIDGPVAVSRGASLVLALPADDLRVTYTALDDRALPHAQHITCVVTPAYYAREIAPARTYVLYEDAEAMKRAGGIKGGTLDNCLVLKGAEVLSTEPLRFPDELARHKVLDLVGDIRLLGAPLRAHLIAVKAGHALHAELTQALLAKARKVTSSAA